MTDDQPSTAPAASPDPGNSPPESWTGEPVDPAAEASMLEAAVSADVSGVPYEIEGWHADVV